MPVTAKLSKSFYDRFGDEIANELVEWFNSVDTTYRNDLRELNDRNFVRFEAGLDRRAAEIEVTITHRFAAVDARFAKIDARFDALDQQFAVFEARFEDKLERRLAEFETRIVERLARSEARTRNWMIGFCTTQLFAVVGLMYTVLHGR
jgi:hypothetical protein